MTIEEWLDCLIKNEEDYLESPTDPLERAEAHASKISYREVLEGLRQYRPDILKAEINMDPRR